MLIVSFLQALFDNVFAYIFATLAGAFGGLLDGLFGVERG